MKRPPRPPRAFSRRSDPPPSSASSGSPPGNPHPGVRQGRVMNPGGSVKDRIGLAMIEGAEKRGEPQARRMVVEATTGNTGIGLAVAAAIKGYRCIFTMPDKIEQEKVSLQRAFGAEVMMMPTAVPPDHPEYYVKKALITVEATPGAIFANQLYNPATPRPTTARRARSTTERRAGHPLRLLCTGGTITGMARFLEKNPDVQVVGGDPVGSIIARVRAKKGQGSPTRWRASAGTDPRLAGLRRGGRVGDGHRRRRVPDGPPAD